MSYDANNNVTYGKANAADDTVMNVWINPTSSAVEGSGLTAGNMSTIWNFAGFNWFRQTIQNQNTQGTAGVSSITSTTILTGANATFANALALANVGPPPPTGIVDSGTSTVSASSAAVPANGISTSTVTVTLRDSNGMLIIGEGVALGRSPANATIIPSGAQTTNASGQAVFTVSSTTVGSVVFTAATSTDSVILTQPANVAFTDPATSIAYSVNFIQNDATPETRLIGVVGGHGETWNQGGSSVGNLLDSTGTVVSSVNVWGSGNTITVLFSEPMNPSSDANLANYNVVQNGVGALVIADATHSSNGASVTLTLDSSLGLDTGYTVSLGRVTSRTGQSLGSSVSRQFRTWDHDPNGIKVFILAGQSNMVGYGNVETGATGAGTIGSLRYLAANDGLYPQYNYSALLSNPANTASAFRTRSDVKVWWRLGPAGNFNLGGAVSKGDLGPPYKGADSGKIGPEFAFGHVIGDFYSSNDVLIIKCAWGGRDLARNFRSSSAVAKRGGQVGDFFNAIIEESREVLSNLGAQFPEWSGRGYDIVGFGWHQGYNDRVSTAASAEFKDNLPDFISDVRKVFNKPNLPFVIGTTGMATGAPEVPPYAGYSALEKAQLWVAGVAQPANVRSTDTRPFWRDPAQSPATTGQGFHWNLNAESYFLVGKALADDMVELLGE